MIYDLNETIVAVSSPTSGERVIVRVSGPATIEKITQIHGWDLEPGKSGLFAGDINVGGVTLEAKLYLFRAPNSYTGDDVAELHFYANRSVTKALMSFLLGIGIRMAEPGEFTARSLLNGKMDLAQAEAVGEVIASSNRFQLEAAEKLLAGRLAETTAKVGSEMIDCLSLIEAGMDFSGEGIEFITVDEAVGRLAEIREKLEQLLAGSISDEAVVDLASVGIAGAPNAGKSSLGNKLTGTQRSIVSGQRKTTRDVLVERLSLKRCDCVLFDCAGLVCERGDVLEELAQEAAVEALRASLLVIFCVDVSKDDWREDVEIRGFVEQENLLFVAAKSDLVSADLLTGRLAELNELFGADFLAVSAKSGDGMEFLREAIDENLIEQTLPGAEGLANHITLTARHKKAVAEAIEDIDDSIGELKGGNDEIAAMMLRTAYKSVCDLAQRHIDEQILENIFSRFCIGK